MILCDGIHITSDTSIKELHRFAKSVGMKEEWFQNHRIPHYDITSEAMKRKVMEKVRLVHTREIIIFAVRRDK